MIIEAKTDDAERIARLFWKIITAHKAYISHGEIQMGIATDTGELAPDGYEKWKAYIGTQIKNPDCRVFISLQNESVEGFVVVCVESDGDKPYGVINDLVVDTELRGRGTGSKLMETGLEWLRSRGIRDFYLESGLDNHAAHEFFERKGFRPVSHVFRLREPEQK